MKDYLFTTELETRDYECDLQGVVNNANYQHYLEYTRHKWLQSRGQSFQQWHNEGIDNRFRWFSTDTLHGLARTQAVVQDAV